MKKFLILTIALGGIFTLSTFASAEGELISEKDKISYIIGTNFVRSLDQIKEDIDFDKIMLGIQDGFDSKASMISDEEARTLMTEFAQKMQKKLVEENQKLAEKNDLEGKAFLKENKENKNVKTTESGLQYIVLKKGKGKKPTSSSQVKVHYKGTMIDGTEFDSSYKRGEPAVFPADKVIPGWTEALQLMNVGSTFQLFIPSDLAYGPQGSAPIIGPNSVLIFEVELLEIVE